MSTVVRELDDIDRRLVTALIADARTSYADLARQVGLSPPSVLERVRRLERAGVLRGYTATVDSAQLGLGVSALVAVHQREDAEQEDLAASLAEVPEVEDCWSVAGEEAFVVKVRVEDVDALEATLGVLRRIPSVARTRTTVVLSTRFEGRRRLSGTLSPDPTPSPDPT